MIGELKIRLRAVAIYGVRCLPLTLDYLKRKREAEAAYHAAIEQIRVDMWPRFVAVAQAAISEAMEGELVNEPQDRPCPYPPGHCPICPEASPATPRDPGPVN